MHIEPGLITGAKMALGAITASGALLYAGKTAMDALRHQGLTSLVARSAMATAAVFTFFEVLPHFPVGVSEVHFILGSTLFLIFGVAPTAIGLALGLLIQGLFFAPFDLPQYGMNLTTLLVPLFVIQLLAKRIIQPQTAYVDLSYGQALKLSTAYQAGVVAWVAFWVLYADGFAASNLAAIGRFGAAYMMVILIEPLVDLAILAAAKSTRKLLHSDLIEPRLLSGL